MSSALEERRCTIVLVADFIGVDDNYTYRSRENNVLSLGGHLYREASKEEFTLHPFHKTTPAEHLSWASIPLGKHDIALLSPKQNLVIWEHLSPVISL